MKPILRTLSAAVMAAFLMAGCAASPSSIAPVGVDSDEFTHLTCDQMTSERLRISDALRDAERRQNQAQAVDATTVLLFLIPASALIGDAESDVALHKGERVALDRAMKRKGC